MHPVGDNVDTTASPSTTVTIAISISAADTVPMELNGK